MLISKNAYISQLMQPCVSVSYAIASPRLNPGSRTSHTAPATTLKTSPLYTVSSVLTVCTVFLKWALWRESEHGDISNLLNGTRSKVNSEGEFVLTARLEDEDYALQSESESETSSDSEESSFESEDSSDDWIRNFHEKVIFDYKNTQKTFSHTLIS